MSVSLIKNYHGQTDGKTDTHRYIDSACRDMKIDILHCESRITIWRCYKLFGPIKQIIFKTHIVG